MHCRAAVTGLLVSVILLAGCAGATTAPNAAAPPAGPYPSATDLMRRLDSLLPADGILLGEQHDAPEHQRLQREVVLALAERGTLAALVIEMAEQGGSTAGLPRDATEPAVRAALRWNEPAWPWATYGPVVMAAVRAGAPVLGANLPRAQMQDAMRNVALDDRLTPTARGKQQKNMREGHCGLLPESQINPMTRIQIARDIAMAQTVVGARQSGKTVLLVAGGGHVARDIGVPVHLAPDFNAKVLQVLAGGSLDAIISIAPNGSADLVWPTPPRPDKDYCADLRRAMPPKS